MPTLLVVIKDAQLGVGLRTQLVTAGYAVEVVRDGAAAALAVRRRAYAVILVGLRGAAGLELLGSLADTAPDVPALIILGVASRVTIIAAIRAGARGYLLDDDMRQGLVPAVAELLAGGAPMSVAVRTALIAEVRDHGRPQCHPDAAALTPRERDTLASLATGRTYQEVGDVLGISEHTVRTHVRSIYPKLGAACRTEAVMAGLRLGLVSV